MDMFKHAPWASHESQDVQEKHKEQGGESLTTILDAEQRGELTMLISNATAAMRKTIESNFDASVSYFINLNGHRASNLCRQRFLPRLIMVSPKKKEL